VTSGRDHRDERPADAELAGEALKNSSTTGYSTGDAENPAQTGAGADVEQVLGLYGGKYFDFNVRHFHEKLQTEHDMELSYTWGEGGPAVSWTSRNPAIKVSEYSASPAPRCLRTPRYVRSV
jgi:hypothetical protein